MFRRRSEGALATEEKAELAERPGAIERGTSQQDPKDPNQLACDEATERSFRSMNSVAPSEVAKPRSEVKEFSLRKLSVVG